MKKAISRAQAYSKMLLNVLREWGQTHHPGVPTGALSAEEAPRARSAWNDNQQSRLIKQNGKKASLRQAFYQENINQIVY